MPACRHSLLTSRVIPADFVHQPWSTTTSPAGQARSEWQTGLRRRVAKRARGFDLENAAKLGTRVLTSSTRNTLVRDMFGMLSGSKR